MIHEHLPIEGLGRGVGANHRQLAGLEFEHVARSGLRDKIFRLRRDDANQEFTPVFSAAAWARAGAAKASARGAIAMRFMAFSSMRARAAIAALECPNGEGHQQETPSWPELT